MRTIQFAIPALVLSAGMLFNASTSFAKKEYTAKEKAACKVCHKTAVPKDGKDLNAVGECYGKSKKLKECQATAAK